MSRLKNKIALITGGVKGIGKAIAEMFANQGAIVIITDILDQEGQNLAKKIGKNASYYSLNVASEKNWEAVIQQIKEKYSAIDILVNNAGITGLSNEKEIKHDPEYSSLGDWQYVHQVNLDGTFLGCKYAIALMKQKGGSIINISSRSGIVGVPTTAAYASSKAAIRNHTKTVALYCANNNYNIRCNSIHPGAILTDIWDPMLANNPAKQQALTAAIPLKRMGKPAEVASAALYFASDESQYTTGSELIIDGGILAGSPASPVKTGN